MSKWDNRFIALAQHIAEWSKDPSTKVSFDHLNNLKKYEMVSMKDGL